MKDSDLCSALAALRPPSPAKPAAARALFRATIALAHAPRDPSASVPVDSRAPLFRRLLPNPLVALPLLAALLLFPLLRTSAPAPLAVAPTAPALELLAQLEKLFPGQIEAVIDREGALQIELASAPSSAPADQPLIVELTRGPRRLRVLSYSGRSVRLLVNRREIRLSPLITGSGQVLLTGEDFAWTSPASVAPEALAGWSITARPLVAL